MERLENYEIISSTNAHNTKPSRVAEMTNMYCFGITLHNRQSLVLLLFGFIAVFGITLPTNAAPEGTPCSLQSTDQAIDYGALITCASKAGDKPGRYKFHGRVGETITAQVSALLLKPGRGFPCFNLLDSDGAIVVGDYRYCGTRIRIDSPLPATGDYVLQVRTDDVTEMQYALSLERVSPPPAGTPSVSNGQINDESNA